MKKSIFFMLCTLLAICVSFTAFASEPKVDNALYDKATDTLASVGVIDKSEYKNPGDFITYSQYLGIVSQIIGSSVEGTAKLYGVEPKLFNEVLGYEDAIKIAVDLLGWQYKANDRGYQSVAASLGLNDGVLNNDSNFCRFDAVMIFYNALSADFLNQTGYGTNNTYSSKNMSLLGVYKDIYKFSGVIQENKWTSVYSAVGTEMNTVVIDDENLGVCTFDCDDISVIDLIGCEVEGFYRQNGSKREILCIYNSSEETVLTSDMYPEYNYSEKSIVCTDSGKSKKYQIASSANVFVNGKKYNDISYINDLGAIELDCVKLYKYNGKINCVHIYTYSDHVVQTVGQKSFSIGFVSSDSVTFDSKDIEDTLFFFDSYGNKISYYDIQSENVISIYKSFADQNGNMLVRVYVYDNSFLGTVTATEQNGSDEYITINAFCSDENGEITYLGESEYLLASGIYCDVNSGDSYKFYIDKNNRIAYAKELKSMGRTTGLYIKIASKDSGLNKDKYEIMIIPDLDIKEGIEAKIISVAENASVEYERKDGTRIKTKIKNADIAELNNCMMHTAMYYYTNSSGEVIRIVGCTRTPATGLLYNFNPDGLMLGTCNVDSNGFAVAKYYSSNASQYGGINSIDSQDIKVGDPETYYGKNHIRYGTMAKKLILLPLVSSTDEITKEHMSNYYKYVNAVDYGYACNRSYAYYNGFSNDGEALPSYGTIAYNPYSPSENVANKLLMLNKGFLVNKVSKVKSPNGTNVYKLEGYFGSEPKTLYSANEEIVDLSKSISGTVKYFDEISEGDFFVLQLDGNGDIALACKMCDYDPVTGNLTLPDTINYFRAYKDRITGEIINDAYSTAEGYHNLNTIITRKFAIIGYPYQISKKAYEKSIISAAYVVDREALISAKNPSIDPEQYVYRYGGSGQVCLSFDTRLNTDEKRINKYTLYEAPSYMRDPSCENQVFLYKRSDELMCTIVYIR